MPGSAVRPSMPGMERSSRTTSGCRRPVSRIASSPSDAVPQTSKPCAPSSELRASRVSGWSSTIMTRALISTLIGSDRSADKGYVKEESDFEAWLLSETLLAGLLGAILALFLTHPSMRTRFNLPELRLVLETTMTLAGLVVAVLAAARFSAEGRRVDLLLASGFLLTSLSAARSGRPDAAFLPHGHARAPGADHARRRRRLGRALPQAERGHLALARPRLHASALRRAAARVPAARRRPVGVAGRLPAHACVHGH